ncbi:MAG TPA: ATP-binding protein [Burkholderiaceae bacterium]
MKIRTYLLLMALAILGPVIVFAALALNLLLDSGRTTALRGMQESARAVALMVDRELLASESALKVLGTSPYLPRNDLAAFHQQAKSASRTAGVWTVLQNESGKQLANTLVPFGTPLPGPGPGGPAEETLRTQRTVVSNLLDGPVAKKPVVAMTVPVELADGRRMVLVQALSTAFFDNLISQSGVPKTWLVGLIDRDGRFIARSLNSDKLVGKPARPELVAAARSSPQGQIRHHTLENVEVYDVYTHTALSGWTVAVAAPVELIEQDARRAIMVAFLGLLAAVVCAVLAAMLFTRRLGLAIGGAAQAAAALGRGEEPQAGQASVVEVADLHSALDDAGKLLVSERASRLQAESERLRLLVSEQEARKLAEAQNQAKDQFLAMLGHEIRNPLSAIAGASTIIAVEAHGNERVARAREVLERQSGNLAHIVDDLLDVTRVTNGKIMLNAEKLDLAMVTVACLDGLRAAGRCEGREVTVTSTDTPVYADRTRLEQIINNLLVNALKYTPDDGHIDVAVYTEHGSAVLTVRDSGVGMSPELLPKVFDLFVQGADSMARTQGGLGIGLTLVRQLVQLHGGSVEAASDGVGKGSKFIVRLPLATQQTVSAPEPERKRAGEPRRVLLIEDNLDGRMMLSMGLGMHGHQVFEAGNGPDGIELAVAHNPDVAVIDIGLPGMNGLEIASALRRDIRTRHIRLIALTGYGQEADRQRALGAGFDEHLVKPANMEMLLKLIDPD